LLLRRNSSHGSTPNGSRFLNIIRNAWSENTSG
jgi:hypothetical protein